MLEFAMGLASAIFVCIIVNLFLIIRDVRDIKDEVTERLRTTEDMWSQIDDIKQRLDEYEGSSSNG